MVISTFVFFSEICSFLQGIDAILYKEPLRTPQFDSTFLNNPSFVGSFAQDDYVYFFFREGEFLCFFNVRFFILTEADKL
jgi:hypothetical protein